MIGVRCDILYKLYEYGYYVYYVNPYIYHYALLNYSSYLDYTKLLLLSLSYDNTGNTVSL